MGKIFDGKRILVLGASSYIGVSFQEYLKKYAKDRLSADSVSLRGDDWKHTDWSVYDSIINVTGRAHADTGTLTPEEKREYYEVNCRLACRAAKKAIADGAGQYIYFSSIIVYGDSSDSRKPVVITRQTKPAPTSFYGDSKWKAEAVCGAARPSGDSAPADGLRAGLQGQLPDARKTGGKTSGISRLPEPAQHALH